MTTDGTIYVLLPVHNRRDITVGFVEGLLAQSDQGFHLVLVDDGSTDGTADAVRALLPGATVIRGTGSWWWAGCLQEAFDWLRDRPAAPGDIVLIINDDTRFRPDFLARARPVVARHPRSLLLAQLYSQATGEFLEAGVRVDWRRLTFRRVKDVRRANCFSTRGLFFRRAELAALGGFHRRLLPHYQSDYAFTIRARRRGFVLASDPDVRLALDESATGVRSFTAGSVGEYLRISFSPRTVLNPLHWTTFILLSCPPRRIPTNLYRVWWRFARGLWRSARARPRPRR